MPTPESVICILMVSAAASASTSASSLAGVLARTAGLAGAALATIAIGPGPGAVLVQARDNATMAGVASRATFLHADALTLPSVVSRATVVTMFLTPDGLDVLAAWLDGVLRHGTRVVSHTWSVPGWRSVRVLSSRTPTAGPGRSTCTASRRRTRTRRACTGGRSANARGRRIAGEVQDDPALLGWELPRAGEPRPSPQPAGGGWAPQAGDRARDRPGGRLEATWEVLDVVVERAAAIVDFILDPTRARRADRVRDVEHSRAANPWADLQAERAWRAGAPDPGRDRHRGSGRAAVVEPGR